MDSIPPQLRPLAKQLREELRAITTNFLQLHTEVLTLTEALKNQSEAIREYAQAKKKAGNVPTPISTPVAISVEAETHERKSVRRKIAKGIEILGIAAVVGYAILTYYTMRAIQHQTDETQQSTEAALRQTDIARINMQKAFDGAPLIVDEVSLQKLIPDPESDIAIQFYSLTSPSQPPHDIVLDAAIDFRYSRPAMNDVPENRQHIYLSMRDKPNERSTHAANVLARVPRSRYEEFFRGSPRRKLYIWGRVNYFDALGVETLYFCRYISSNEYSENAPLPVKKDKFMECEH